MVRTKTKDLINELKAIIANYSEGLLSDFEDKLYEIHLSREEEIICELIFSLKDDFEYDELMFSIIHTIEDFEDSLYVSEILKTLPNSVYTSPRWMSIIFMRILNSGESLNSLVNQVLNLDEAQRVALKKLFEAMGNRDDEIKFKVLPILSLL